MAYDQVEPFGERRADLRAGIIAATVANAAQGKRRRAFTPADFLPTFDPPRRQAQDIIEARLNAWADMIDRSTKRRR